MNIFRRLIHAQRKLYTILGAPGLIIGVFSVLSFVFGIYILVREYNRPRQAGREIIREVVKTWLRLPDYLGLTLVDYANQWYDAPRSDRPLYVSKVKSSLTRLGTEFDHQSDRFPLVQLLRMEIDSGEVNKLATWQSEIGNQATDDQVNDVIALVEGTTGKSVSLHVVYRIATPFQAGVSGIEKSYRQLLLGLLGLSGFSLLCLGYMIFQAKSLSERAAREAAQLATLDLADRTCHELGNGIFILSNEQRNLSDHLDLVERFILQEPEAREAASRRAGLAVELESKLEHALRKERSQRGIDPEMELRGSVALTRRVCQQIQICAEYIGMTVQELDGFLKRSELPTAVYSVDVSTCIDEALALLRPKLEFSGVIVELLIKDGPIFVFADRRLLIHVLVNLIKNSFEAIDSLRSDTQKAIRIEATRRSSLTRISVSDEGPGISPEIIDRIFDFGYSTKGTGRGRGLGIVRDSVELLGGSLEVRNRSEGGAEFWFEVDSAKKELVAP